MNAEISKDSNDDRNGEFTLNQVTFILWKNIKTIMAIALLCTLLSLIYSFFILKPKYEAVSELLVSVPVSVETPYGTYTFPTEKSSDYSSQLLSDAVLRQSIEKLRMDISIQALRSSIKIINEPESEKFEIFTSGTTGESAVTFNKILIQSFEQSMRIIFKQSALDFFINSYKIQIDSQANSILIAEKQLIDTKKILDSLKPLYVMRKSLFDDPKAAASYADTFNLDLSNLSENVMIEEYANENYFTVESEYMTQQLDISKLKLSLDNNKKLLDELQQEKQRSEAFGISGENEKILNSKLDVFVDSIIVLSNSEIPQYPVGPNKKLYLVVGVIFGLLLGCLVVFIKEQVFIIRDNYANKEM